MVNLEDVLKIPEKDVRQKALAQLSRSLRINLTRAKKDDGSWDEDMLTVMIYDALKNKKSQRSQAMGLIIGAVFLTLTGIALILLLSKLLALPK